MKYLALTQYSKEYKEVKNSKYITGTCLDISGADDLVVVVIQFKGKLSTKKIKQIFVPSNTYDVYIEAIGENDK